MVGSSVELHVRWCMLAATVSHAIAARISLKTAWDRSELVSNLQSRGPRGVRLTRYDREKDGLLWTGSSWFPGRVFADGFTKHPKRDSDDPGEDLDAWGAHIGDSITKNTWAYGFHMSTDPRVAAQFGVFHLARLQRADARADFECDDNYFSEDAPCNKTQVGLELLDQYKAKYGCPAPDSKLWTVDEECYGGPCIRIDKLSDPDFGEADLCPNFGYAYLVKAEGVQVRIDASAAFGKDYSKEQEVFVPMRIKPSEVLGAIPIYARKPDGRYKNPGLTGFAEHWDGKYGFKTMTVPGEHTITGAGATSGIGAFIYNPSYQGDNVEAEVTAELERKGISSDLGTVVPREIEGQ